LLRNNFKLICFYYYYLLLGKIADANETLEYILERMHTECGSDCPNVKKCLSHEVFGGTLMEQAVCRKCGASSEPALRNNLLLTFQAAEVINESRILMDQLKYGYNPAYVNSNLLGKGLNKFSDPTMFGKILNKCNLSVGMRSCPSNDDPRVLPKNQLNDPYALVAVNQNTTSQLICDGKAEVHFHSLDAPLSLAISIGMYTLSAFLSSSFESYLVNFIFHFLAI